MLFLVALCVCVYASDQECPQFKCKEDCKVYVYDVKGCRTCECTDLCKDVICGQGRLCKEFQIHANNSKIAKCVDPSLPLECQYPPDASICKMAKKRFYFNTDIGSCREFEYGGCMGNGNNFHLRSECASRCVSRDTKTVCPEVMCAMYCEHGFQKNEDGCDICKCREQDQVKCNNTLPECSTECPHGYLHRKDSQGCPTCECRQPDRCPGPKCRMYCQFGFRTDSNGCEMCQCMEDPCKNRVCSSGEVCETIPICSPEARTNCHYYARCSASYSIKTIRVQLAYEHFQERIMECKNLIESFVRLVKERLIEEMKSPETDITFIEVSPDKDIYHVTIHVANHGHSHLVPMWHSVEGRLRDNINNFIIIYHGHVFTPRKDSLMTSYYSREQTQPPPRVTFYNIITIMACVVGVSIIGFAFAIKARRTSRPHPSKRINVIYRQAQDSRPLV